MNAEPLPPRFGKVSKTSTPISILSARRWAQFAWVIFCGSAAFQRTGLHPPARSRALEIPASTTMSDACLSTSTKKPNARNDCSWRLKSGLNTHASRELTTASLRVSFPVLEQAWIQVSAPVSVPPGGPPWVPVSVRVLARVEE